MYRHKEKKGKGPRRGDEKREKKKLRAKAVDGSTKGEKRFGKSLYAGGKIVEPPQRSSGGKDHVLS